MPQSGMAARMAAMRSRYHSRVYLRFMALSTALLPDCTGRCMWRQILGVAAMTAIVSSDISLGWEVVKRTRICGAVSATIFSSLLKSMASASLPPSGTK